MAGYQVEVAEAVCSALYMMPQSEIPTEFLGEADIEEGHAAWFHVGVRPLDLRVTVLQPKDRTYEVLVRTEWRNYKADARNPLKAEHTGRINTFGATAHDVRDAAGAAVVNVLEIYRDVLREEGVAGWIKDLQETSEETEVGE
jgi:hypothetical protein